MKNRLIEEMDRCGRNWQKELEAALRPHILEELTREHIEQEKGVEFTESFLNHVEEVLRDASLEEFPGGLPHQASHYFARHFLHSYQSRILKENLAPEIGAEALARGGRPLNPTKLGSAILNETHLPFYSRFYKKPVTGMKKLIHSVLKSNSKAPEPPPIKKRETLLTKDTWANLLEEADPQLHFYEYDLERHLAKEDDVLFPEIEKLGGAWKEVSRDLIDQHAQQRDFIKACRSYWQSAHDLIQANASPIETERACIRFFQVFDTFLQHLVGHFDYEDNYVFGPAEAAIGETALQNLEKTWAAFKKDFAEPKAPTSEFTAKVVQTPHSR